MAKKPPVTTGVASTPEPQKKPSGGIVIFTPKYQITGIKVIGTAPLIVNAMSKKYEDEMREKRSVDQSPGKGARKTIRPKRDFDQEFRDSLYPIEGTKDYGFPAVAFKHAMVGAVRQVDGLDMTTAKRLMFVLFDATVRGHNVVKIIGKPELRQDTVRLKDGSPDIRIRGGFFPWAVDLRVEHNVDILSQDSLFNLLVIAGKSDGVGEWRPSSGKTGDNGTFRIAQPGD